MKASIKLEFEIDIIPYYKRSKKSKYFELKFLCFRAIIEGIF